jgi:hypothetical protein
MLLLTTTRLNQLRSTTDSYFNNTLYPAFTSFLNTIRNRATPITYSAFLAASTGKKWWPVSCTNLAFKYRLYGSSSDLTECSSRLNEMANLRSSDLDWANGGAINDLVRGEIGIYCGLAYDWVESYLSSTVRTRVRDMLTMLNNYEYNVITNSTEFWINSPSNNHHTVHFTSYMITSAILRNTSRMQRCHTELMNMMRYVLPVDGGYFEGMGMYWMPYIEQLAMWSYIDEEHYGSEIWDAPYWRSVGRFRRCHCAPNDFSTRAPVMNWGDSSNTETSGDSSSKIMFQIAAKYNNGADQWFAKTEALRNTLFTDVYYYTPGMTEVAPASWDREHYFADSGWVFKQSSWGSNGINWGVHCGPPLGYRHMQLYRAGTWQTRGWAHCNGDSGAFQIYVGNQRAFIDDGYVLKKKTINHSVMYIQNAQAGGQRGGDRPDSRWFDGQAYVRENADPEIEYVRENNYAFTFKCQLRGAYHSALGISRYNRYFLIFNDGMGVVWDDYYGSNTYRIQIPATSTGSRTSISNGWRHLISGSTGYFFRPYGLSMSTGTYSFPECHACLGSAQTYYTTGGGSTVYCAYVIEPFTDGRSSPNWSASWSGGQTAATTLTLTRGSETYVVQLSSGQLSLRRNGSTLSWTSVPSVHLEDGSTPGPVNTTYYATSQAVRLTQNASQWIGGGAVNRTIVIPARLQLAFTQMRIQGFPVFYVEAPLSISLRQRAARVGEGIRPEAPRGSLNFKKVILGIKKK